MAYSRRTPNYNLPQYENNDKPSYLTDFNGAMLSIDNALKSNSDNIGNLSNLTTTDKSSLVGAINEVASSSGGTSDYSDLTNKPSINSVTLSGNKTSSDLGIQAEITNASKLSSDLVDDTNATNLFVTSSDKTTWNGKQDALVSGTNIKTINNTSILGSGDLTISGSVNLITTNTTTTTFNFDEHQPGTYYFSKTLTGSFQQTTNFYFRPTSSKGYITLELPNSFELHYFKNINDVSSNTEDFAYVNYIMQSSYYSNNDILLIGTVVFRKNTNGTLNAIFYSFNTQNFNTARSYVQNYYKDISGYDATKNQLLNNSTGTLTWVDGGQNSVIYLGKINNYDTSAKALVLDNYSANTRILLKQNDNTRSMFISFNGITQEIQLTSASDVAVMNNLFILDINSISSTDCAIAFTWSETYQWAQLVTIYKGASFSSGSWTVNANQYNLLVYPLFQVEEDSSGNLTTQTLQELTYAKNYGMSKTRAPQRLTINYVDKDKNNYVLCMTSFDSTTNVFEGTAITKTTNTDGLYEVKKVNLTITHSSGVYSSHTKTITSLGVVINATGFSASSTQTLKNVNGTLTWVND